MQTYYAVLAFVNTLAVVFGMGVLAAALWQVRRTARKMDRLADHVDENVQSLREVTRTVEQVSTSLRSGWLKGLEAVAGWLAGAVSDRMEARKTEPPSERPSETHGETHGRE